MHYKAQELILHFGLAKTGTSALQRTLFDQRENLLKNHDTLYPGKYENHFHLRALFAENPESLFQIQMLALKDSKAILKYLESYRQEIITEINTTKPRRIIISSEAFPAMKVDELRNLQAFLKTLTKDIVPFAYVRDPWSGSISLLQEQILTGLKRGDAKFIYRRAQKTPFERFEDVFGVRAVVAPYMQGPRGFNVVVDFCQRFDLNSLIPAAMENTNVRKGMNLEATCVMLQLNQLYPVFDENNNYIPDPTRDLMRQTIRISPLSSTPLKISMQTAKEIYENSKADIELLEERYFDGNKYFTEHYKTLVTEEFDDTLSVATLEPERLSEFLLFCMHELAERAVQYHEKLEEIKNSKGWKILIFLRQLRAMLAPPNSFRDRILQQLVLMVTKGDDKRVAP